MSPTYCSKGREPISVEQPPGGSGTHYPFLQPSADIYRLFADAYFGYEASLGEFTFPFRVAWIYGFGTSSNSPILGRPTPTHDYDIVIEDADGDTVFDSTLAGTSCETRDWGSSLRIVQWMSNDAVCRVVYNLCWDNDLSEVAVDYLVNLEPENAILHADTIDPWHKRLRKLIIESVDTDEEGSETSEDVVVEGMGVVLSAGYNLYTEATEVLADEGDLDVTDILLDARAGAGAGLNPDCSSSQRELQTINAIQPDEHNNYTLEMTNCYRLEPVFTQISSDPVQYSIEPGQLKMYGDCTPCCKCSDYEAVYNAIVKLNDTYMALGDRAEDVRDLFEDNVDRWVVAGKARIFHPLRLAVMPGSLCRVEIAGAWCNNRGYCMENVELRFSVTGSGALTATTVCGRGFRSGNLSPTPRVAGCLSPSTLERYAPLEEGSGSFSVFFDKVDVGGMAYGRFQVLLDGCTDLDSLSVTLGAWIADRDRIMTPAPLEYNIGWPDNDSSANIDAISVSTPVFYTDPCSDSSV